jgi:hypothetical protein
MEQALLEDLLDQVRSGKRAESGFKKKAWQAVLPLVQAQIVQSTDEDIILQVSQSQASNKVSEFKSIYIE